eukprot:g14064.t2
MESSHDVADLGDVVSLTGLQATLQEFLRSRDGNEMIGDLSEGLEARREDLVCPDPSRCYPKTAEDRAALQSGSVVVKGYRAKLPPQAVSELVALSDELNMNEVACVELWSHVNEPYQRRELEQRLSEPPGSLSDDLPLAARKLFYLERRNLLLLESELLKAALVQDLSAAKKAVIDREIFGLLERGLASNLMSFVAKLLGPEGMRQQTTPSSASNSTQAGVAAGAFGAPASVPGQAGGGAPAAAAAAGGISEGATARREEFMLESLVCAVEVLFFIFYSYQIKPDEAKQLVALVETAGRELLALQKAVAAAERGGALAGDALAGGGSDGLQNNSSIGLSSGFGAALGAGSFARFGGGDGGPGGATAAAAEAASAESRRDVFRLCAVMEVTSVLLCTLSMALSQDNALYSRSVPGAKNDSGNELSSLALASGSGGGGGGVQPLSPGDAEVIVYLNKEICTRVWDHQQVQAAVMLVWASFAAPFALAQQAFATTNADQHVQALIEAAGTNGAIKFLRGAVLSTLRRPPFPARSLAPRPFYLEALSTLAAAYMAITLDESRGCRLPPRVTQQEEELEAAWQASAGGAGSADAVARVSEMVGASKKEDTLEDVVYWVGHLSEAYPEFADKKLWVGGDDALPAVVLAMSSEYRDLLGPLLRFLGGAALKTAEHVHLLMSDEGADCGWNFFIRNMEGITDSLHPPPAPAPPANNQAVGANGSVTFAATGPAPRVKLSLRAYDVVEPLCGLLERVMLDERVRRPLATGENFRVLTAMTNLVRCGVRPKLKGAIFKALAACAKDPEIVPHIWAFIEEAQLVPTSSGGGGGGDGGAGQGQRGGGSVSDNSQPRGLFAEMEQVESREGTYPATEGFCCLIQVMLVLLRRYPLTAEGASLSPGTSASLATPADEEACRMDFDTKASDSSNSPPAQRRYKSPGYYILREILGQGGLFRQMMQVLNDSEGVGGVAGLKQARTEAAASTVVKHAVLSAAVEGDGQGGGKADGGALPSYDFRFGAGPPPSAARTAAASAEPKLDPVRQGLRGPVEGQGVGRGATGRLRRGPGGGWAWGAGGPAAGGTARAGRGSLAPPAYLGSLLSEQGTIAAVARYIEYEGNMVIPLLSSSVLLSCSRNLPAGSMMGTLMASAPRECDALAEAYTCCLSADGLSLGGKNLPTIGKMLCPPNGEADSDFMTLDPALIGAGTSERADWAGDEGVLRTVRLCILDLLLENVEQRGPNLSHLLLGLLSPSTSASAAAAATVPKASVCLEAVVGLLKSPMIMEQEPRLAEKCSHLLYKLCSCKDTRVSVLNRLRNASGGRSKEAFFPQAIRLALGGRRLEPAAAVTAAGGSDPKPDVSFGRHCLAWLLKAAAIDLRTSCEGIPVHVSYAKSLLRALFGGGGGAGSTAAGYSVGGFGNHAQQRQQQRFGLFNAPSSSSSYSQPYSGSNGLDQAPAPLLTLLESKIELGGAGPDRNPGDAGVRGLLIQAAIPLPPPGGCAEAGGEDFRIIDVEYLHDLLRMEMSSKGLAGEDGALSDDTIQCMKMALAWSARWNQHTDKLASQAHLCQAWRQVLEVAFVSAGALLFGPREDPSKAVVSRRVLPSLLLGILRKLTGMGGAEERLLQPLGRACLSVAGVMRDLGAWAPLQLAESKQLISSLVQCLAGSKGDVASPKAGTPGDGSKPYRAFLYGCLVHLLEHTQGDARLDWPSSSSSSGGATAAAAAAAAAAVVEPSWASGAGAGSPSTSLGHEALREGHRLQNREILREHIEPLAYMLNEDCRNGPSMTQCLGLSALSSIVATLGPSSRPSSGADERRGGVGGGAGSIGMGIGCLSEDEKLMKELQGTQTRTALLGFLHGKTFFGELSKLLGGVRPGSGVVVPQLVVDSILGLLTQVACSSEGAKFLLEAGVVERLTESEGMGRASQIATEATKLGALGVANGDDQAPAGVFQPDGPESLRVLVTPPLLVLQGMLASLPANALLAEQAAALLARHARLVRHVLLFKESSLDALDAMSAVLAVLAHVSKPPYQGVLDRAAGAEAAREWRDLTERALIAFGGNPFPQGRGGGGGGWWGGLQPLTPRERSMANERCQAPPGGPSEWSVFDTAKLEASQRALAHAVNALRCRAAAEATAAASAMAGVAGALPGPVAGSRLAVSPEGLCLALRACVENGGGGGGRGGGVGFGGGGGLGVGGIGGGDVAAASNGATASVTNTGLLRGLPYVVEGLLATLLDLVDAGSEEGRRQLAVYRRGLVPTLTELLQDTSKDPYVLRAARALIGRVSGTVAGREGEVFGASSAINGSTNMDVA